MQTTSVDPQRMTPPTAGRYSGVGSYLGRFEVPAPVLWFTGLSGSGKSTLCRGLEQVLVARCSPVHVLDGDELRQTLCADLGFTYADRIENIRRIGVLANTLANSGVTVLVAAITPYQVMRSDLRKSLPRYVEVYVDTPLATCIARDPKGLYVRAMAGQIQNFTGISDVYEMPESPDIVCSTDHADVDCTLNTLVTALDAALERRRTGIYVSR
ncbi:MAG: adenylyl-sulfate kinase [Acidobacteriota bacterium]